MKKRAWMMLLLLAVLMLCLAGTAGAEQETPVWVYFDIIAGSGDSYQPEYPDFAGMIGEGLTDADFDIIYPDNIEGVTFGENGYITVADDVKKATRYPTITYVPKVEGVGVKTSFIFEMPVCAGIDYLRPNVEYLHLIIDDGYRTVMIERNIGAPTSEPVLEYDSSVIHVEYVKELYSWDWKLNITPVALGKTDLIVTAYNGKQATVPITVVTEPTQVAFGASWFGVDLGKTVDIGLDLGNNSNIPVAMFRVTVNGITYGYGQCDKFFPDDTTTFHGVIQGYHKVVVSTLNGHEGTVYISVYGTTPCASISAAADAIYVGDRVMINAYGADGTEVTVPLSVTGGDATLDGPYLIPQSVGDVEVTASNPDGTVVKQTFHVNVTPTEILLNADEIALEPGERFELKVSYDQGSRDYKISEVEQSEAYYGMKPIRVEGDTIIAQTPGTAVYQVTAGDLSRTVKVTVEDADTALTWVLPPEPVGIGRPFQMSVQDKTGKVYPATFSGSSDDVTVTEDGYFRANEARYVTLWVTLEDGRKMQTQVHAVQVPTWLAHNSVRLYMGTTGHLNATSDVGDIWYEELIVEVEDESIVTYLNGNLRPLKTGKTTVKISSIYSDASTTFTLEVRNSNDGVFIAATSFDLPYGFSTQLPAVYDEKGNEKNVKWVITHDNPGKDNPEKSGFKLDGNKITCIWPDSSCEVTGYMDGASKWVRVSVFGYKMPDAIYIEPEVIVMEVGDTVAVEVLHDEPGTKFPAVYWVADTAGIIAYTEVEEKAKSQFTAYKPGTTLVMAYLDNGAYALCMVTVYDPNDLPDDPSVRLPGDADVDGAVTILDALAVLQCNVGWGVEINASNANVDGDEEITILDALRILQHCVGWEVELL